MFGIVAILYVIILCVAYTLVKKALIFYRNKRKLNIFSSPSSLTLLGLTFSSVPFFIMCVVYFLSKFALYWILIFSLPIAGFYSYWIYKNRKKLNAPQIIEKICMIFMGLVSTITLFIALSTLAFLVFNSLAFFKFVSVSNFLFKTTWYPQFYEVFPEDSFGVVPVILGSVMVAVIALIIAGCFGLLSAIYLSEYATRRIRNFARPILELLSSIPTIVYGYFAAFYFGPFFAKVAAKFKLDFSVESALAAGIVIGAMIIPYVISLTLDNLRSVPKIMRDSALSLGSTKSETIINVIIPYSLPGIFASLSLAFSRAIGETMIVVMSAGLVANMTLNPFEPVTTATVQIVNLLTGDQEFNNPVTLSAFAIGLLLFILTFCLNIATVCFSTYWRKKKMIV